MVHTRFFEDLGRVLYVLAINDGQVQEREQEIVEQLIDEALLAHPDFTEVSHLKNAMLTKISFRNAVRNGMQTAGVVEHFNQQVVEDRVRIGKESLEFAWKLINGLFDSWKGTNVSEQEQLLHFHRVFFGKDENDGV
ncbi:MAG TPA: hypothetical protein PLW54_00645 [Bacteroidia bacterium]|jgi:hypothetical protein|uniref:hypothetical protein n=1 Tax=Candidatus Pollutiaquabacter sp. TaxID=3416354 RepID=UPI002CC99B94|nr:hypothetical protein [Bacteroidota bacterium]HRI40163.1 hypothetical protein [Bacteroidia bacterium]